MGLKGIIKRAYTKHVRGGEPTDDDVFVLQGSSTLFMCGDIDPLRAAIVRIVKEMALKLDNKLVEVKEVPLPAGSPINELHVGRLLNPEASPEDVIIRPMGLTGAGIDFVVIINRNSVCYKQPEQWRSLFEKLGFQNGGEARETKYNADYTKAIEKGYNGDIDKGCYFVSDRIMRNEERVGKIVHLDQKSLVNKLGIDDLNIDAILYKNNIKKADKLGVNYVKYLEARGEQAMGIRAQHRLTPR